MLEQLRTSHQSPAATAISIGLTLMLIPFVPQMNLRFPPPTTIFTERPFEPPSAQFLRELAGGETGGGGQRKALPAGRGSLRFTAIPLAPIRPITNVNAELQVPPAVEGPELDFRAKDGIGLPWSKYDHNSLGTGGPEGVGDGKGRTAGNHTGSGFSRDNFPGGPGYTVPSCVYCPNPSFTDEAIKAKFQGTVLLRVLVNAEGRAEKVQILKGVGLGLDEQAREKVFTWRFRPGRNPAGQAVPAVATIEVQFRQF